MNSVITSVQRPTIICLTPVKNESWILEHFLRCTSLWADHIIIADQMSSDDSCEIARRFSKVILVENQNAVYDEAARTQLLIEAARKIEGPRLLIALDADEFLSANFLESSEWQQILKAKTGTVIRFHRINIHPNLKQCWDDGDKFAIGFIDDNDEIPLRNSKIHNIRIPFSDDFPQIICRDICFLHYQYIDLQRVVSKNRWYQCWETLNRPYLHAITLYRNYNTFLLIRAKHLLRIKQEWILNYEKQGIKILHFTKEHSYWWDTEVKEFFKTYGEKHFSKLGIWQTEKNEYKDPRSIAEKILHWYLKWSQPFFKIGFPIGLFIRIVDKFLKWIF